MFATQQKALDKRISIVMRWPHISTRTQPQPSKKWGVASTTIVFNLPIDSKDNNNDSTNELLPTLPDVTMKKNFPPDLNKTKQQKSPKVFL